MAEGNFINLYSLTLEELSGVVNLYPWFAAARVELCKRMADSGAWTRDQFANQALHIPNRRLIAALADKGRDRDFSDSGLEKILNGMRAKPGRASGGDFFSQDEYDSAGAEEGGIKFEFPVQKLSKGLENGSEALQDDFFYTETLAHIYEEQGYPEEARKIYTKLILAFPEKNAYFASLIDKLDAQ